VATVFASRVIQARFFSFASSCSHNNSVSMSVPLSSQPSRILSSPQLVALTTLVVLAIVGVFTFVAHPTADGGADAATTDLRWKDQYWSPSTLPGSSLFLSHGRSSAPNPEAYSVPYRVVLVRHADVAYKLYDPKFKRLGIPYDFGTSRLSTAGHVRAHRLAQVLSSPRAWNISAIYAPQVECVKGPSCHGCKDLEHYAIGGTHEVETIRPTAHALGMRVRDGGTYTKDTNITLQAFSKDVNDHGKTIVLVWNHLYVPELLRGLLTLGRGWPAARAMIEELSAEGRRAALHWDTHPNDFASMFELVLEPNGMVRSIQYGHEHLDVKEEIPQRAKFSIKPKGALLSHQQVEKEYLDVDAPNILHDAMFDLPRDTFYAPCPAKLARAFYCGADDCCQPHTCGTRYQTYD